MTYSWNSQDFPGLGNSFRKFHNCPGCVGTLLAVVLHYKYSNYRQLRFSAQKHKNRTMKLLKL